MTRIQWTEPAREDLRQIHAFIARDSQKYASRMISRIKLAVDGVRRFPLSSARVPEWDEDELREVFVAQYRIIYRVSVDLIQVLAVVHGARRLSELDGG